MGRHLTRRLAFIHADHIHLQAGINPVEHHKRSAAGLQKINIGMAVNADVKQAIHLLAQQIVDQLQLAFSAVTGIAQQHHHIVRQRLLLQLMGQRSNKRIANIRHYQSIGSRGA